MAWDDEDEVLDALDAAEEYGEIDEEYKEDLEEFVEEIYELGDEDFEGPGVTVTITTETGEEFHIRIPAEYIPDLIDLASTLDIDIEFDS